MQQSGVLSIEQCGASKRPRRAGSGLETSGGTAGLGEDANLGSGMRLQPSLEESSPTLCSSLIVNLYRQSVKWTGRHGNHKIRVLTGSRNIQCYGLASSEPSLLTRRRCCSTVLGPLPDAEDADAFRLWQTSADHKPVPVHWFPTVHLKYLPYYVQQGLYFRKLCQTFPTLQLIIKVITYILFTFQCQRLFIGCRGRWEARLFLVTSVVVDDANPLWTEETDSS